MPLAQPPDLYEIYLETSAIVDLDPTESRHEAIVHLSRLLQKYNRGTPRLRVRTSEWSLAEAQGVLYEKELIARGIQSPIDSYTGKPKNIRNTFPPVPEALEAASRRLQACITSLGMSPQELLYIPQEGNALILWQIVQQIGKEAGIFPADSIHLAMSLLSGCSMLVVTDFDFINKADYAYERTILPLRRRIFSYPEIFDALPSFQICCLANLSGQKNWLGKPHNPAINHLRALGFR